MSLRKRERGRPHRAITHAEEIVDDEWMARAIALTRGSRPHPNPRVGAVVVTADGLVAAEAAHGGIGKPHAERMALERAGPAARGATLYCTLEPCVHTGRTPPCVDRVIEAAVGRVVVGAVDPDPRVGGRGVAALRAAGIEVTVGVLEAETEAADPGYFHHCRTGRPRVTLKAAVTLDGQLAAADGSSRWITGPEARRDAHLLRADADAVVIGAGTLLADDPQLTVRLDDYEGPQPVPVVIAGGRPLPEGARLFQFQALVLAPGPLEEVPAEVLIAPAGIAGRVDLSKALELLGDRGLLDVVVEGGSTLFASFVQAGLWDRFVLYFGARLAGGVGKPLLLGWFETIGGALDVRIGAVDKVGEDLRVEVLPGRP
jgi:diaminohydroxyphosphoribosylaminopyrimidine deaminase/5-amino-6-(5-phosphoribosylamino)uracil reductase